MTQAINTGRMAGRVCLVTGGSSGIGLATAIGLARLGATVVIVGREQARTEAAVQEVRRVSGNSQVDFLVADLASQAAVRDLAAAFQARYPALHVLVNNAGAAYTRRVVTTDKVELTFAVNYLAPFLLTDLLLDTLKRSAPSRIVNVSSEAQRGSRINFADSQAVGSYGTLRSYGQAKLALVVFTYELARRLEGSGVTANVLHPGVVASGFGTNNGPVVRLLARLVKPFLLTTAQGAETTLYVASAPELEGVSGQYFIKSAPARSNAASYDRETARRLWQLSLDLVRP